MTRPSTREPPSALTPREELLFEAGIKLGGIFHQYLGTPVSSRTANGLATAIAEAVALQPYVHRATVGIDVTVGGPVGPGRFAYHYLRPEMLSVRVELRNGAVRVVAEMSYRKDLRYPLMHVVSSHPPAKRGPTRRPRS
ncbi:MAG: dihydroneopterin aldolase family protein [Thermoplasmata archaeon]|nr:dihydroneopterin aldolase family protein [Thermoplasmata archaeon]